MAVGVSEGNLQVLDDPPTAEAGSDTGSVIMDGRSYVDNVVVYARPIQD